MGQLPFDRRVGARIDVVGTGQTCKLLVVIHANCYPAEGRAGFSANALQGRARAPPFLVPKHMTPQGKTTQRFRFSLRAALLFVTVVAVPLAIGANYFHQLRLKQDAVNHIRQHADMPVPLRSPLDLTPEPRGPEWLRKLAGPDIFVDFSRVYYGPNATDADLPYLSYVPTLEEVNLEDTAITDRGLAHLRSLKRLEFLWLEGTQVTPAGARELSRSIPDCQIVCDFALYHSGVIEQLPSREAREP